jgi:uncharacterized protein YdcH (DUF465 family)
MRQRAFWGSVEALQAEHRELDLRLRQLGKRSYLTAAEQLEVAELKKRKLRAKDAIASKARDDG